METHWRPPCSLASFHGTSDPGVWECDGCPNRYREEAGPPSASQEFSEAWPVHTSLVGRARHDLLGEDRCPALADGEDGHA